MSATSSPDDAARAEAKRWLAAEPDADMRAEIGALLDGHAAVLTARFVGRVQFGTAGLRAAVGAGPQRMNRLVVRQAAAGLAEHLLRTDPDAARRGVVIGFDARRKSDVFALDSARVFAARGIRAFLFDAVVPTPVLAWNITGLDACAGVMVTASHNPPADNGYKVYLSTGAQIVPPADTEIAAFIDGVDPCAVPLAPEDDPLVERVGRERIEAYLAAVDRVPLLSDLPIVAVAYTALHGVGGATLLAAFERLGWPAPHVVAAQQEPDGTFPTVGFPNPEESGAMDLLLAEASRSGAMLALANDPDADRLGAAIPTADGGWRKLNGDEIGWLLADHILRLTTGDERLVVTTLVSSSMLGRMAARHHVHHLETFTGFKWIGRTALDHPELRLVLGYEQALGYLVADRPLDKDGITAAVMLTEVASAAAAAGESMQDRLDRLAAEFGRHITMERSIRMAPEEGVAAVEALRAGAPDHVGGHHVTHAEWFAPAGLLRWQLGDDLRVQVRPSGTEPKVKFYAEGIDRDPTSALDAAVALLDPYLTGH